MKRLLCASIVLLGCDNDTAGRTRSDSTPIARDTISPPRQSGDGAIVVDFNERLQNVGGACAASAIRHSVTNTLGRLPGVTSVRITAAGSEKLALQP